MTLKKIEQIVTLFENSKLNEMDVEFEEIKISLRKSVVQSLPSNQIIESKITPQTEDEVLELDNQHWIVSPLVGTFYRASSPSAKPFVEVGQEVHENDILCVIEAMKVMNEIRSNVNGKVKEISVDNNDLVEYDQRLIRIEIND